MKDTFLSLQTNIQLLQLTGSVIDELTQRGICRSGNNPLSDYTEWLVAQKLGLTLEDPATKGFDAAESSGIKYEIKGRRLAKPSSSRQLSAIRDIANSHFHFLIAVIYNADFTIKVALKIPRDVVVKRGTHNPHTNSIIFHARDIVLKEPGVSDITKDLL